MSRKAKTLPRKPPSQRGNRRQDDTREEYDPNDRRYTAVHEAAHAVAAIKFGTELLSVDLKKRRLDDGSRSEGFTKTKRLYVQDVAGKGEGVALSCLVQQIVGALAESTVHERPEDMEDGDRLDMEDARRIAAVALCEPTFLEDGRMMITPEEQQRNAPRLIKLMSDARSVAIRFVNENAGAIELVASFLLDRTELSGSAVAQIVKYAEEHPELRMKGPESLPSDLSTESLAIIPASAE